MEEKRRGYKTQKQQTEATKRYLEKNPEAKAKANRSRLKSTCLYKRIFNYWRNGGDRRNYKK